MKKSPLLPILIAAMVFANDIIPKEAIAGPNERFDESQYVNAKTLREADSVFKHFFSNKKFKKGDGHKQFERWRIFAADRADAQGNINPSWDSYTPKPKVNLPPSSVPSANWIPIGPFSWDFATNKGYNPGVGRVNGLTEDPKNSNILYASTPWAGLWKSSDAGSSWTNITDNYGIFGGSDLVVDHQNSSTLYFITGDRDEASHGSGVWKSTDAGQTWSKTGLQNKSSRGKFIRMHATNNNILVAADNFGTYITKDAGNTWEQIPNVTTVDDIEFLPANPNILFLISASKFFYYDVITNITTEVTGLNPNIARSQIAVSPAAPNRVNITGGSWSGHAGNWWYDFSSKTLIQKNFGSINMQSYGNNDAGGGQLNYDYAYAVSPIDANKVYYGAINAWYSDDGGVTFKFGCQWDLWDQCKNYTHADIHGISTYGNRIYYLTDGGIFVSNDHMSTTKDITKGLNITMFDYLGQSPDLNGVMVGGTQDNGFFVRKNGVWTTKGGGDAYGGFVDLTNQDIMYYTSISTYRSTDSFDAVETEVLKNLELRHMSQSPKDINILLGSGINYNTGLYRSIDRGQNWTLVKTGSYQYTQFVQNNPNVAWTISTDGPVFRSSDAGLTWTQVSNGLPTTMNTFGSLAVDPSNDQVAWVIYSGTRTDKVYKTINAGKTWTDYSANLAESATAIISSGQGIGDVYVSTPSAIQYRDNTMNNWILWNQGLPSVRTKALQVHLQDKKLRAATWGRGVWEADLYSPNGTSSSSSSSSSISVSSSSSTLSSSSSALSSSSTMSSSSSNLVANKFTVSPYRVLFKQEDGSIYVQNLQNNPSMQVALYDTKGIIVRKGRALDGQNLELSLQGLEAQNYFVKIIVQGQTHTQKVVISNNKSN